MKPSNPNRALLACGVVLAPLFYVVVIAQMLTRAGFNIRIHPLSLLSLGDYGWIQIGNFLCAGALAIACAVGMRLARRSGRRVAGVYWLIGTFGLGMIVAGLAVPDPLLGFPPGAPSGVPARMSLHASLHGVGFAIAFLSLISACFVAAWSFFRCRSVRWALYSVATAIVTIALLAAGFSNQRLTSLAFFVVGIVAFGWLAALAFHLLAESAAPQTQP
jgi:hypothetical protein